MEIAIRIPPVTHDSLSAFLFDLGCTGIVLEDFEDYTIKAYFPFQTDVKDVRNRIEIFLRQLKEIFPEADAAKWTSKKIEDQDWHTNWRRFFHPTRVTPKLMVVPPWEPLPATAGEHVIRIDPGPAFGTGQHPTTRMCLEAMEALQLSPPWTMLDVGTGSGILAIYGAILGAKEIEAIDVDPEALRWARHNIELNGLTGTIEVSSKALEERVDSFSLIVANLILEEILRLFPHFYQCLNPEGALILSGLLREHVDVVQEMFEGYGFTKHQTFREEEWACVVCIK
jgi:ribosomal protein L11 methyltransferase